MVTFWIMCLRICDSVTKISAIEVIGLDWILLVTSLSNILIYKSIKGSFHILLKCCTDITLKNFIKILQTEKLTIISVTAALAIEKTIIKHSQTIKLFQVYCIDNMYDNIG